jgi:hypothetical protein
MLMFMRVCVAGLLTLSARAADTGTAQKPTALILGQRLHMHSIRDYNTLLQWHKSRKNCFSGSIRLLFCCARLDQ